MLDFLVKFIAPHYCYGCNEIGAVLCTNCKNYIIDEKFSRCTCCLNNLNSKQGFCYSCKLPYSMSWCVTSYDNFIKDSIWAYKFNYCKQAHVDFAELLDLAVPVLPSNVVVTSIPTAPSHIRQRGYDHIRLIAKKFAKIRQLKYTDSLYRTATLRQRDASRKVRLAQAKKAYTVRKVDNETYLLIDDVVTTGATISEASRVLLDAGAKEVWVAVIARQILD